MKVGSIVECVGTFITEAKTGEVYPVVGGLYTVRFAFTIHGTPCIALDEIVNPKYYTNPLGECMFWIEKFREIIFPESLESEITESLNRVLEEKI